MREQKITLAEHLEELRGRIFKSVIAVIIASCAIYSFVGVIYGSMIKPVGKLHFIAPQEAFIANIKIAFFAGILLASPVVLYQLWRFIAAALTEKEKKSALIFGILSFVFFIAGASFGYFVITPIGIKFLMGFASNMVIPMITVSKYISFVGMLTMAFGAVFQLPLASLFLTKLGIVTPKLLSDKRKHAIVAMFVGAAVLTPPDVVTQCLMAVPLLILYEIGIVFSKIVYRPI